MKYLSKNWNVFLLWMINCSEHSANQSIQPSNTNDSGSPVEQVISGSKDQQELALKLPSVGEQLSHEIHVKFEESLSDPLLLKCLGSRLGSSNIECSEEAKQSTEERLLDIRESLDIFSKLRALDIEISLEVDIVVEGWADGTPFSGGRRRTNRLKQEIIKEHSLYTNTIRSYGITTTDCQATTLNELLACVRAEKFIVEVIPSLLQTCQDIQKTDFCRVNVNYRVFIERGAEYRGIFMGIDARIKTTPEKDGFLRRNLPRWHWKVLDGTSGG